METPSTAAKSPKRFTTPSIRRNGGSSGRVQVVMLVLPLAAAVAMLLTQVTPDDLLITAHQPSVRTAPRRQRALGRRRLQPPSLVAPVYWAALVGRSTGLYGPASRRGCAVAHTAGR